MVGANANLGHLMYSGTFGYARSIECHGKGENATICVVFVLYANKNSPAKNEGFTRPQGHTYGGWFRNPAN